MMEFLSTVSPKLGWIITGGMLLVFVYIGITNWRSQSKDTKTKQNGTDLKANIVDLKLDERQGVNNHLTAAVTVKYIFKGEEVIANVVLLSLLLKRISFFLVPVSISVSTMRRGNTSILAITKLINSVVLRGNCPPVCYALLPAPDATARWRDRAPRTLARRATSEKNSRCRIDRDLRL
jgi:hypothetical protein